MVQVRRVAWSLATGAVVALLVACGGSSATQSTSTVEPTKAFSPTATTAPSPTPSRAATSSPAGPAATPTRAAATPTRAALPTPTGAAATATPTPRATSTGTPAGGGSSQVIDIDVTSDPYLFIPDTFTFQVGKKYTLRFKAPKEAHTFTVAGLALDILIYPGQVTEQAVSFNDIGTYKLVCSIHEQLGQTGKVIVTQGP